MRSDGSQRQKKHVILCVVSARFWLIFAVVLSCDKPVTYEPPPEKRVADVEHQSFDEAKSLAARGDIEGAHSALTKIKSDSPLCSAPEFVDIQNRWAKARLEAASKEPDKKKKLALLEPVAQSQTVGGEIRAQANQKIDEATPDPAIPPPDYGYDRPAAIVRYNKAKALYEQGKAKDARDLLIGPVTSHNCAPEEIDLLESACYALQDRQCEAQLVRAGIIAAPPAGK